jgi:hypothetical protein
LKILAGKTILDGHFEKHHLHGFHSHDGSTRQGLAKTQTSKSVFFLTVSGSMIEQETKISQKRFVGLVFALIVSVMIWVTVLSIFNIMEVFEIPIPF